MASRTDATYGVHTARVASTTPLAIEVNYLAPGYAFQAVAATHVTTPSVDDRVVAVITPEAVVIIATLPTT